jgi:AbrB family looped-hinge helix DNA binding protein
MKTVVTLDRAGRIVLPKSLRDELRLTPGDTLDVRVEGDEVTLRPRRHSSPMHKKDGIWVFTSGKPLSQEEADEALRKTRANRDRQNAGETE